VVGVQNRCAPAISVGDSHVDRVVDERSISGGGERAATIMREKQSRIAQQ
jgi:hypothetical protein